MPKLQRAMYASLASISFGLGVVGLFVPLMPTTCFMLLAVWLASRGSPRFALWIRRHPRFGPPILAWEGERAIPRHAKWLAVVMLALSAIVIAFTVDSLWLCGSLIAGLVLLALWIATRPEPFQPLAERSVTPSATEPPTAERLSTPSLSTQRLSTQRLGR